MAAPGPAGQQEDVPMVAAANLNAADVPVGNPPVAGNTTLPDSSLETHSSTVSADTHSNEWAIAPDESHGGSPELATRVKGQGLCETGHSGSWWAIRLSQVSLEVGPHDQGRERAIAEVTQRLRIVAMGDVS